MAVDRNRTKWNGWGWDDQRYDFHGHEASFLAWLGGELGVDALATRTPSVALEAVAVPPSRLGDVELQALRQAAGGADAVRTGDEERVRHAVGRSLMDTLRLRAGSLPGAPDAVAYPGTEEAVAAVLDLCRQRDWAVIPFGGGSSVVGGVEAVDPRGRPVVTLDVTPLCRLLDLDEADGTATFEAGAWGPDLEQALNVRGWSLGHVPQSFEFSTLGGWIAARSSGQQSNHYGDIADLVASCRVVTPSGTLATWNGPVSGAGPDLRQVVAGSEGTLGVITRATVRIHRLPATHRIQAVMFPDFARGTEALRTIVTSGLRMSYQRLSDAAETNLYLRMGSQGTAKELGLRALGLLGYGEGRSVMLVGTEGEPDEVDRQTEAALEICKKNGGFSLGRGPAKNWHRDRYRHPYLRDDLLDHGIATETHETAVPWSRVAAVAADVKAAVAAALAAQGRRGYVMGHLSHSYRDGTCIYFILMYPVDATDPAAQWHPLKAAICDAIARHGGTVSHHHGVGLDHKPWLVHEKGPLGLGVIAAAARSVDPTGICNPGKLVDRDGRPS